MPSLVAEARSILVPSPPDGPGQTVLGVPSWVGDDDAAQLAEQFGDGDGDQAEMLGEGTVKLTLVGGGHGDEGVGEQGHGAAAVTRAPADDLSGVQAAGVPGKVMGFLGRRSGGGAASRA